MRGKSPSELFNCPATFDSSRPYERGSVLIIVLWIAFGLVSLTLYFANSMSFELRAADNRAAAIEAEQAIAGAARYVSNLLATAQEPGNLPDPLTYRNEAVPVGEATFWLLGRSAQESISERPVFGLVDEGSKLNLNTATADMLQYLPGMTAELAGAIQDWRDTDDEVAQTGGAESQYYQRLNPPYRCKNGNFESPEELRLVSGAQIELLFGEDANLNGILDFNENDALTSAPNDNRDGRLDHGLLEHLTTWTRESTLQTTGTNRVNVTQLGQQAQQNELRTLLQNEGIPEVDRIVGLVSGAGQQINSVLQFYRVSRMSQDDFAKIEASLTFTNGSYVTGLVNVNTASEAVLSAIPGIGVDRAASLMAYRTANRDKLTTVAWVADVLTDDASLQQAGRYLTGKSYQFSADIAAVGRFGRGFRRVKFIFDTSDGAPRIVYRQDLTHLGWPLGREVRNTFLTAKAVR